MNRCENFRKTSGFWRKFFCMEQFWRRLLGFPDTALAPSTEKFQMTINLLE